LVIHHFLARFPSGIGGFKVAQQRQAAIAPLVRGQRRVLGCTRGKNNQTATS
jgi:hypothetical protein